MNNYLISSVVSKQVPDFIRSEYPLFVTFLEKYYEWLETPGNVIFESESLKTNYDVDLASDIYIEQIKKEFLPYFPQSLEIDKRTFLKFVSRFYATKGTPDSVKFLFRALFNEEIQIFYPKDDILKASDGKWVLPLSLRVESDDENIFNLANSIITGRSSKATALVESVVRSVDRQLGISYIELYISNIQRLFETGETIFASYNDGVTTSIVEAKLIGSLSEIKIDPDARGIFYRGRDLSTGYEGDPVTIVGGLNPDSSNPIGAVAFVGTVTDGGVTEIFVTNGGFGFRDPSESINGNIVDFKNGFLGANFGTEARGSVSLIDSGVKRTLNVACTTIEVIETQTLDNVGDTSNAETSTITSMSDFQSFNVYPISFVSLLGSGGGYRQRPSVEVYSFYNDDNPDSLIISSCEIVAGTNSITVFDQNLMSLFEIGDTVRLFLQNRYEEIRAVSNVTNTTLTFTEGFQNNISGVSVFKILRNSIYGLGSLGRLEIISGGENYQLNEYLIFTGGSGYGANAKITELHSSNNGIKTVEFIQTDEFVIGGEGYKKDSLPSISVNTANGSNAIITVSEVSGDGESFSLATSRIGAISSLRITSFGYDYTSAPTISLRNADINVSNVTPGLLFVSNTKVYQGSSNTSTTFEAFVDKFERDNNLLRVFNYTGQIDESLPITSDDGTVSADVNSFVFYGDGRARATATFENGLIRYPGLYLNTDGHLSEDKYLQDGEKYHNFSYVINTTKDYNTFSETLNNIVHPVGMKTFVNRIYNNSDNVTSNIVTTIYTQTPLEDTFNISISSNNMISTNPSANLIGLVSVGDVILLKDLLLPLEGTVNTVLNSNSVIGTSTNFLNQIQDGDLVFISTGNTEIVTVNSNTQIITQNTIGVNSNDETISLLFTDAKQVTSVTSNTIFVDSNFIINSSNVSVILRKVE
jgi:hypothetical protein